MKAKLLRQLRRKAYQLIKIDEAMYLSGAKYYEIRLYSELGDRLAVYDMRSGYFIYEDSEYKFWTVKEVTLEGAIIVLKEARREWILQQLYKIKVKREKELRIANKEKRREYLHQF